MEGRTMYLSRITPPWKEGFSGTVIDNYKIAQSDFDEGTGDWIVVAEFPHFGEAERHRSDFEVEITWSDIETIIEKFCDISHPGAVSLREAAKLATAMRGIGWIPPKAVTKAIPQEPQNKI